jgi:glycosyltransferase involved in cell wall biosynthesis
LKQQPFFSIIIPTFNRANLLPKAINSVLAQTFAGWELIVVDDGSTDNTADIVTGVGDERVRYIYQTNAERCAARNNGISHSNGRYICFLDSDDYYLPERLALLYDAVEKRNFPVEMFYTGVMIDLDGNLKPATTEYTDKGNVFDNIAQHIIGNPQACIHREIFKEFKYDTRFRIGEDMELWLRIATRYKLTYLENQYTFVATEHADRSVNVMKYNSGGEQLKLYRYILSNKHPGHRIAKATRSFMFAGCYHAIARYYIHRGQRWIAVKAILQAIIADRKSDWTKFRTNILIKLITLTPLEKVKNLIDYQ